MKRNTLAAPPLELLPFRLFFAFFASPVAPAYGAWTPPFSPEAVYGSTVGLCSGLRMIELVVTETILWDVSCSDCAA